MADQTSGINPEQIETLLMMGMVHLIGGKIDVATMDAMTAAAHAYVDVHGLTDLEARIEEIERWKTTFRTIQPAALSA